MSCLRFEGIAYLTTILLLSCGARSDLDASASLGTGAHATSPADAGVRDGAVRADASTDVDASSTRGRDGAAREAAAGGDDDGGDDGDGGGSEVGGPCTESCEGWCEPGVCFVKLEPDNYIRSEQYGAIAVDDANVYWTAGYSVKKQALAGGATTTLFTTDVWEPSNLAVDTNNVYWTAGNGDQGAEFLDRLISVPIGGGSAVTIVQLGPNDPIFDSIAANASGLYLTEPTAGTTVRMPSGGGPTTPLASEEQFLGVDDYGVGNALVASSSTVAWITADGIVAVPSGGGATVTFGTSVSLDVGLAIDSTHVYWSDGVSILATPVTGGSPVTLAQDGGQYLATDTANVYWIEDFNLMKVPKDGGTPVILDRSDSSLDDVYGLVASAHSVFVKGLYSPLKLTPTCACP